MIPTRRAALARSGNRFPLRQTRSVCAEIMLKPTSLSSRRSWSAGPPAVVQPPDSIWFLERRNLDSGSLQRRAHAARDLDRTVRVAVDADRVGAHLDHLAGDGNDRAVLHHPYHPISNCLGVMQ